MPFPLRTPRARRSAELPAPKLPGFATASVLLSLLTVPALAAPLVGTEDGSLQTSFVLDDFALTVK